MTEIDRSKRKKKPWDLACINCDSVFDANDPKDMLGHLRHQKDHRDAGLSPTGFWRIPNGIETYRF